MVDSIAAAGPFAQAAEKAEWGTGEMERWRDGEVEKIAIPFRYF
jgi:hypothetical protein